MKKLGIYFLLCAFVTCENYRHKQIQSLQEGLQQRHPFY